MRDPTPIQISVLLVFTLGALRRCLQDLMFTMKTVMGGQRGRGQERSMKVSEARAVLEDVEAERLVSEDMVMRSTQNVARASRPSLPDVASCLVPN